MKALERFNEVVKVFFVAAVVGGLVTSIVISVFAVIFPLDKEQQQAKSTVLMDMVRALDVDPVAAREYALEMERRELLRYQHVARGGQ